MKKNRLQLSSLRFACTGCGACCMGHGDYRVEASRTEQRRIQRFLRITWRWFRSRYVTRYQDGTEGLRWQRDRCVFLDPRRRCRIYAVRPRQCRTFPFWPEVVRSDATWREYAKECEGIGRGSIVPLKHVQAQLRRHAKPNERGG